jgi:hypothetical protein
MKKITLFIIGFMLISSVGFSQSISENNYWEVNPSKTYNLYFQEAYQTFPNIPKGILESIAYTNTHLRDIKPDIENPSCLGLPSYYGVMGLVTDGKGYFKNNLQTIALLSGYSVEQIQQDAYINIMAFAKAYSLLMENYKISAASPENHISILDALSELPNDGQATNNFAFDSHLFSIFKNLNDAKFQDIYQLPAYKLNLEKIFGRERYQILNSSGLILDERGLRTNAGKVYNNQGQRSVLAPPCSDLSVGFSYPVVQDGANPANFSSRLGSAVTHITIHTMQGSMQVLFLGSKIQSQGCLLITSLEHPMDKLHKWFAK